MRNKKQIVLYNVSLPLVIVLFLGGYVLYKMPQVRNRAKEAVKNMIQEQSDVEEKSLENKEQENDKPDLENTTKIEFSESEINAMIATKIPDHAWGGSSIESLKVTIDGKKQIITGEADTNKDMKLEFSAKPYEQKPGIEILDLDLVGAGDNRLFSIMKNPLKSMIQKAINKAIEDKAENVKYIQIEGDSLIIYLTSPSQVDD